MAGKSSRLLLAAGAFLGQIPPQLLQRRAPRAPYLAYLLTRSCLISGICLVDIWAPRHVLHDIALGVLLGQDALLTWLLLVQGRPICALLKQLRNTGLWAWWALLGTSVGASLLSCSWGNLMWCWMFVRFHTALGALWALLRHLLGQARRLNRGLGGAQDLQALMARQLRLFATIAQVNRIFGLALFGFIAQNVVLLISTLSLLLLLDLSQFAPQHIVLELCTVASFQVSSQMGRNSALAVPVLAASGRSYLGG